MLVNKADLKYTLRLLAKRPAFTLLSIVVLALGLGLSVFTFTMSYTFAFKPIPLQNGASIYGICAGARGVSCWPFKAWEFAQIRAQIGTLDNVGIYTGADVNLEHAGQMRALGALRTEWNMFRLSETEALLGRTLQEYDQQAGAEPVVVLGHALWQLLFGGDPGVIGTAVNIDGELTRVVGVMPEGYEFPARAPMWLPVSEALLDPVQNERVFVSVFGLLKDTESVKSADAEISALMQRVRQLYPAVPDQQASTLVQRLDGLDSGHISTFPMQSMAGLEGLLVLALFNLLAGLIFLLACINVGTLLLARTNERLKDIAVRTALGAPRFRLLLQSMGESIAISVLGGALALLVAGAGLELLNWFVNVTGGAQFWMKFHLDGSTLLAVMLFISLTILLTSVLPGWRIINGDFNAMLRDGTRGALGLKPGRFSRSLVTLSIVLITLVLYAGVIAGSFFYAMKQSFANLDSENILSARLTLDPARYADGQLLQLYDAVTASLGDQPTIEAVVPLVYKGVQSFAVEGRGYARESDYPAVPVNAVGGPLNALDVTLLEGRFLNAFDIEGPPVALVNRSLAAHLWPGQSAIGQRLRIRSTAQGAATYPWRQVVGVVSDTIVNGNLSTNADMIYLPLSQDDMQAAFILVKHSGDADTATALLAQAIQRQDAEAPFTIRDLQDNAQDVVRAVDAGFTLVFGCVLFALLVAVAGIFGLGSNHVQLHTSEIGTRRALGAPDRLIRRTFILRGSRQALLGFVAALLITAPFTYMFILSNATAILKTAAIAGACAAGLLAVTVLLAIYYPIRKVLAMEPSEALRYE